MKPPLAVVKVTYYLEVLSSWCHWAEPAWAELKARYAGRVEFHWKIAAMNPGDFPASRAQCDWFYQRSGTVLRSPLRLNSGWVEPERQGVYPAPNLVAEAARDFLADPEDDRVRLALAHAAMGEGQKIGDLDLAAAIAARAAGLDFEKLRHAADSAAVKARVEAGTAEFHGHRLSQRPAFILESAIGDKAVFSGLARGEPLAAAIDAMLADAQAYVSFAAHFGSPPAT
ncbi:MAG: DsbA family protein [Verrucomicrobia bacterium]|nr:DsbA family protein [Verrucomicrobiota bacterium]